MSSTHSLVSHRHVHREIHDSIPFPAHQPPQVYIPSLLSHPSTSLNSHILPAAADADAVAVAPVPVVVTYEGPVSLCV